MSKQPDTARRKLFGFVRSNLAAIDRVQADTAALRAELTRLAADLHGVNTLNDEARNGALETLSQVVRRIDSIENLRLRTLSLLLTELESRVGAVESGSEGMRQRLDLAQTLDAQAAAELTRLDESNARQARAAAGLKAGLDVQGEGLAAIRDLVGQLEERAQDETEARTQLALDVHETAERANELEQKAEQIGYEVARNLQLTNVSIQRLSALEIAAAQGALEATRLDQAISDQSARAGELEQKLDNLAAASESAAARGESLLDASAHRMSALEGATVQASLEATRLERAISGQSTRATELDWKVKASNARIATLEERIESLTTRLLASEQRHVETGQELNRIETASQKAAQAPEILKPVTIDSSGEGLLPPVSRDVSRDSKGRTRSAIFLHSNYYHFYYLARALRERGWDAWSVSVEQPDGPHSLFYHGQDLSLWDPDHTEFANRIGRFNAMVEQRFKWLQFSGDGMMTVSPWKADGSMLRDREPTEFIRLRQAGVKIGYTISGCNDGNAQSTWNRWTGERCKMCRFRGVEDVCSDIRNLAWAHKRNMFCDLIAAEQSPRLDYNNGPKVYSEPLTMALGETHWQPSIKPPKKYVVQRAEGEILVFHAVGAPKDVEVFGQRMLYKGTPAIVEAVEQLRVEGIPIRLLFSEAVPSVDMRFLQVQADIIVDQLNSTRYGAFAREAMMLGKPVIARIDSREENGPPLKSLEECPIVHADLGTIKDVLRALALDPERRNKVGKASREYAMKWHSASALAERFERVYDHVLAGGDPSTAALHGIEATHH